MKSELQTFQCQFQFQHCFPRLQWAGGAYLHHGRVAGLEDLVGEDPRERQLDGELEALVQLEPVLSVPEIGQVGHLEDGAGVVDRVLVEEGLLQELLHHLDRRAAVVLVRVLELLVQVAMGHQAVHDRADEVELGL